MQTSKPQLLRTEYETTLSEIEQQIQHLHASHQAEQRHLQSLIETSKQAIVDLLNQQEVVHELIQAERSLLSQEVDLLQSLHSFSPKDSLVLQVSKLQRELSESHRECQKLQIRQEYTDRVKIFLAEMQSQYQKQSTEIMSLLQSNDRSDRMRRIQLLCVLESELFDPSKDRKRLTSLRSRIQELQDSLPILKAELETVTQIHAQIQSLKGEQTRIEEERNKLPNPNDFEHLQINLEKALEQCQQDVEHRTAINLQKYQQDLADCQALKDRQQYEWLMTKRQYPDWAIQLTRPLEAIVFGIDDTLHEMVLIPKGQFTMGANQDDDSAYSDEHPRHLVELTTDFFMAKYPVTQGLWHRIFKENPSRYTGENHPVENVSWFDAIEFCNRLSRLEGLNVCYSEWRGHIICDWQANGYRLPTEAEWEYAARGGEAHLYAGWSRSAADVAWFSSNSNQQTQPVGLKKPNGYGLHDMSGNVWEWIWNRKDSYGFAQVVDPKGQGRGTERIIRGGAWNLVVRFVRVSMRGTQFAKLQRSDIGFRICRTK